MPVSLALGGQKVSEKTRLEAVLSDAPGLAFSSPLVEVAVWSRVSSIRAEVLCEG